MAGLRCYVYGQQVQSASQTPYSPPSIRSTFAYPLVIYLALALILLGAVPSVSQAGIADPQLFNNAQVMTKTADTLSIVRALEEKQVAQRLSDLGISPDAVRQKLTLLSSEQLHSFATEIDTIYAGGSDTLSFIISLLLIVLLVVLILQASGHKVIVTKG